MRKIRDVLRLRLQAGLSFRQISLSTKVSVGAIQKLLKTAEQLQLAWPLPDGLDDTQLARLFYPAADTRGSSRFQLPDWPTVHQELKRKGMSMQLLWQEYTERYPNRCYSYSQFCERYRGWCQLQKRSMRQQHKAGEKCFIDYVNVGVRDSTYVLDGLLYHESDLRIEEHYTDTAGFTDHVFALMHLLGFRFAPRIRDLGDTKLYIPKGDAAYEALKPMIGGTLNIKHVRAHWDEILRLATSIKQGTVTASLMLRKLGSYPRQNGLAVALRELGRIERTLFILDWLQSVELRRRVHAGLNKGEARNALARAVFFNRLGEIRDRSFEQQRYRASGLNLVTAAIVLWNTVYLERAANALRGHGQAVDDGLLQYLSPLGWEHINLTGDYLWRSSAKIGAGKFRPLRPLQPA